MLKDTPYWWEYADPLPNLVTRPLPNKADVVVVGSGYTGLSAARTLALRGVNVVVLEKETFGWGASSRNGGQVLTGLKLGPSVLIKQVGLARAKELYALSLESIQYLDSGTASTQRTGRRLTFEKINSATSTTSAPVSLISRSMGLSTDRSLA